MTIHEFTIGGLSLTVPKTFKTAATSKAMSQKDKVALLAGVTLTCLYRAGTCSISELAEKTAGKVSGRLNVTLGAGVGGQGGMRLLRSREGNILLCRDNVANLIHLLGHEGFAKWAESESVTGTEFQDWLERLPSVDG